MDSGTKCEESTVDAEITTWADGFGIWHASVPLTDNPEADADTARQAIIAELTPREGPGFAPARVQVTREMVTNHGTAKYREVTEGTEEVTEGTEES